MCEKSNNEVTVQDEEREAQRHQLPQDALDDGWNKSNHEFAGRDSV